MNENGQITVQSIMAIPIMVIGFLVFVIMFNAIYPILDNQMVNMTYYSIQNTLLLLIPFIVVVMIISSIWMLNRYRSDKFV